MSNLGPGFSGTSPSSLNSASMAALLEGIPPSTEKKQKKRGSRNSSSAQKKLANEDFLSRAKPEVVARERENLKAYQKQLLAVDQQIEQID